MTSKDRVEVGSVSGAPGERRVARRRVDLPRLATVAAPLLGVGGFALIKWIGWGSDRDEKAVGGAAELAVWQFLIAAQVVVWAVFAGVGLRATNELGARVDAWSSESAPPWRARWRGETAKFLAFTYGAVGLLLAVGGAAGLRNPYVMPGQDWKVPLLHVVAGAAALPFFVVLKRVQLCAAEDALWSTTAGDVARVRLLRGYLRSATACLGTVIALAVVATGALRQAVEAATLTPLPKTFVIVYGAWFTGILAAVYLYVSSALERRAGSLLEDAAPLPDPVPEAAEEFAARRKLRSELSAELGLGGDPRKDIEGLVAVLSPLGGALLTQIGGL